MLPKRQQKAVAITLESPETTIRVIESYHNEGWVVRHLALTGGTNGAQSGVIIFEKWVADNE